MILNKIAELSKKLGVFMVYEYNLTMDPPKKFFCSRTERYRISAEGYKNIYLANYEDALALTIEDFEKEEK